MERKPAAGFVSACVVRAFQGLATIPEFIWELGLGIYATVWGFKASSSILAREAAA